MKIKWVSHPFVALIRIISSIRPWRENADIRLYVPSARWNTGKVSARASGAIPVRSGKARIRTLSPIFSVLPRLSFIFLTSNVSGEGREFTSVPLHHLVGILHFFDI